MINLISRVLVLSLCLLVFGVQEVLGQEPPAQSPPAQAPPVQNPPAVPTDSVSLVFEREVFFYPQYERRDPFAPLTSADDVGPRFEGLRLFSVIHAPDPAASVALLGPRGSGQVEGPGDGQMYRVRRGDHLGNIRILQIQESRIVVEVEEFGMREQRIMELQRPGQGGLL